MLLTWYGISREEIKTIIASDIKRNRVTIRGKGGKREVEIKNELFEYFYNGAFGNIGQDEKPFTNRKLDSYHLFDCKATRMSANDLYISGLIYRIYEGDLTGVPKSSSVITDYYKKISKVIYDRE